MWKLVSLPLASMVKIPLFPISSNVPCLVRMQTATRDDENDSVAPSHSLSIGEEIGGTHQSRILCQDQMVRLWRRDHGL